jgi:uncharacterized damage-inducible protein DinB
MINDDIRSLFAFNRWADRRVLQACRSLSSEQYVAEPVPGWSSVASTILHITMVTDGWLRGLTGEAVEKFLTEAEVATPDHAERCLDRAYETFESLPLDSPDWLANPITLRGRGRLIVLPPWAVLRHVVNHSTYHRGQVASKLKRFGVEQPATDLIFWAMEHFQQQA